MREGGDFQTDHADRAATPSPMVSFIHKGAAQGFSYVPQSEPRGFNDLEPESRSFGQPIRVMSTGPSADTQNWFELDSHACFVTDLNGRLLRANPAARAMVESGVLALHSDGLLSFGLAEAASAADEALKMLSLGQAQRKRVVLQNFDGLWRSMELHLAPGPRPTVFITVRAEAQTGGIPTQPLVEAFHLTPTQAEVLAKLCSGLVPKDIGRRMGISTHTVRTHLRAIFAKLRVRGISGTLRLMAQLLH